MDDFNDWMSKEQNYINMSFWGEKTSDHVHNFHWFICYTFSMLKSLQDWSWTDIERINYTYTDDFLDVIIIFILRVDIWNQKKKTGLMAGEKGKRDGR